MGILRIIIDILRHLADFLFPKSSKVIALEKLSPQKLLEMLPPCEPTEDENTLALFDYRHALVKELVWEIKYKGNHNLAEKIGGLLYDTLVSELLERNILEKFDAVVLLPMPISDRRRLERGWNQAELLANAIRKLDTVGRFKYYPRQLVKIRHTERQTIAGSRKERLENLRDSMLVQHSPVVMGKFVVLVDDVTTTGASFSEAKRALKEAGAKRVLCLAFAH